MRAAFAQSAIVVTTILALTGCRSTGDSGWGMPWGRGSSDVSSMSGPELPSAGAMHPGTPASAYDYNAPPAAGPYDQAGAGAYPANAYGVPPAQAGGYPAPPATGYAAPPNPAAAGYAAAGYDNYGTPSNYGAQASAVTPQTGPYNENYAQQPPATSYATAPPAAVTPQNAVVAPYPSSPTDGSSGNVYANPYATGAAAGVSAAAPADSHAGHSHTAETNANATARYQTADATGTAAGEQSTANPYPAATSGEAGAPSAGGSSATGYQPGNTGYNPGQTGYLPPGSTPYQPPDATTVAATQRRNPYYRPGSTSDYLPSSNSQAPAGSTDRYGAPSTATGPGWPTGY